MSAMTEDERAEALLGFLTSDDPRIRSLGRLMAAGANEVIDKWLEVERSNDVPLSAIMGAWIDFMSRMSIFLINTSTLKRDKQKEGYKVVAKTFDMVIDAMGNTAEIDAISEEVLQAVKNGAFN